MSIHQNVRVDRKKARKNGGSNPQVAGPSVLQQNIFLPYPTFQ